MSNTINIKVDNPDYSVAKGVGPVIGYHGRTIDLRKVSPELAKQLAEDPGARYVTAKVNTSGSAQATATDQKDNTLGSDAASGSENKEDVASAGRSKSKGKD